MKKDEEPKLDDDTNSQPLAEVNKEKVSSQKPTKEINSVKLNYAEKAVVFLIAIMCIEMLIEDGIWSSLPLLIVIIIALIMGYRWRRNRNKTIEYKYTVTIAVLLGVITAALSTSLIFNVVVDPVGHAKRVAEAEKKYAAEREAKEKESRQYSPKSPSSSSTPSHKFEFMAEYDVKKHLKKRLLDPDSLQDLKCQYQLTRDNGIQVFECTYRAKNRMGGYERAVEQHWFDSSGTLLETGGFK